MRGNKDFLISSSTWLQLVLACYGRIGNVCDNCPDNANTIQEDTDSDGTGDICDRNSNCPAIAVYGNLSDNAQILRSFRDKVLSQTPEGQELIKLYYQWSPIIVKAMEEDEDFKENPREMIDAIVPMIRKLVE